MSTMKMRNCLAAAFVLLCAFPAFTQVSTPTCQTGTLASYIALGSGGCMFGSVLYRDFTFTAPVIDTINPNTILVTPAVLPETELFQGFNFSPLPISTTPGWTVAAGQNETFSIGYNAVPFPPAASPAPGGGVLTLDLGQSHIGGIIGSVTVQEVVSTPASALSLEVYDTCDEVCSLKQTDNVAITPSQTIQSLVTVTLSGGNGGASLQSFAFDYAVGPQPE
jgi:hypothetical protein